MWIGQARADWSAGLRWRLAVAVLKLERIDATVISGDIYILFIRLCTVDTSML